MYNAYSKEEINEEQNENNKIKADEEMKDTENIADEQMPKADPEEIK